jgi:pimeloyl-ACP methyl ester carboxylesterase
VGGVGAGDRHHPVLAAARVAVRARRPLPQSRGRLAEIRVPTLLVWGRDDRVTPPDVARRFQSLLRDARLVFLPSCGHAPMLEQPDAFAATVENWLETTRPCRHRAAPATRSPR